MGRLGGPGAIGWGQGGRGGTGGPLSTDVDGSAGERQREIGAAGREREDAAARTGRSCFSRADPALVLVDPVEFLRYRAISRKSLSLKIGACQEEKQQESSITQKQSYVP